MRRRLLSLTLAGAILAGGATQSFAGGSADGPLRLEAKALQSSDPVGRPAAIEVTATNTGNDAIAYMLPTPCHSAFKVIVHAGRQGDLALTNDVAGRVCAQVVVTRTLRPGDSVTERFTWAAGADVAPGTYTADVTFAPLQAEGRFVSPAGVQVPVRVGGPSDTSGHWAGETIQEGLRIGFVAGDPGGCFRPDDAVTRAEFIKMLVIARGLRPSHAASPSFTDVAAHWVESQGYLEAAVEAGLIHPEDYAGIFSPDTPITRQEIALVSVRAMALERSAVGANPWGVTFTDKAEFAPWATGYIAVAQARGVLKGYGDNSFRPARTATRAEAVTLILRVLKGIAVKSDPTATITVDGSVAGHGVAVMEQSGRALASLDQISGQVGVSTAAGADGWYTVARGDVRAKVKPGVPYALCTGCPAGLGGKDGKLPLDVAPPVQIDGRLFLPETALRALGLAAWWDDAGRTFVINTNK